MKYGVRGEGFFGTDKVNSTTKEMEEVLDFTEIRKNPKHTHVNAFYKFNFDNKSDCTVFINGSNTGIFLEAGNQWFSDIEDAEVFSFKIKEAGISYKWVGHY